MKRIPNLNKIKIDSRIFYNPDHGHKIEYNKIKIELIKKYCLNPLDRDSIIKQLIASITHGDIISFKVPKIPMIVLRTDIKNFYPSINKHELYIKLKNGNLLSNNTFRVLQSIFFSGAVKGVPMGLSFSSALSEIYLEKLDDQIKAKFEPAFYSRFVDDIIILIYDNESEEKKLKDDIISIFYDHHLKVNDGKTIISRLGIKSNLNFSYLGYNFTDFNNILIISIAPEKLSKIVNKIKNYFYLFKISDKKDSDFWKLYYRLLNTIYGVTSTNKDKTKAHFGLGNSYKFVNDETQIIDLLKLIKGLIHSSQLNSRRRSALFYIIFYNHNPLEILGKRIDYTKMTKNQISKIKNRLGIVSRSNSISLIFYRLYLV